MPAGTEKNDIIFFLMNAGALRLASNRWGWDPQVDKEQQQEGEPGVQMVTGDLWMEKREQKFSPGKKRKY